MGARQSKRSVDITTTPKKEGAEDQQQALDGRLGHIEEGSGDIKPAANGAPTHTPETQVSKKCSIFVWHFYMLTPASWTYHCNISLNMHFVTGTIFYTHHFVH